MPKITPAKRVDNMVKGLEELIEEYRTPEYAGLRMDIQQAINALRKVWKSLVG